MKKPLRNIILISFLILYLSACQQGDNNNLTPTNAVSIPTTAPTATDPPVIPTMILLSPPEADGALFGMVQPIAEEMAGVYGLVYEHRSLLTTDSAPTDLRVVVALPPYPGLADLVARMPGTQFIAVGIEGLPPAVNLTVISSGQGVNTYQGFMAGYIAAMESVDWRVGIISETGTSGQTYRDSFINGALYYCGSCTPYYPPFLEYPLYYEVDPAASLETKQAAAENLIAQGVNTMHVSPGIADDNFLIYLAQRGMRLVGTSTPPEAITPTWIVSIESDLSAALRETLSQVLETGASLGPTSPTLKFNYVNPAFITEARLVHLEEILNLLETGVIDPLID